ncbi:MAG: T9SS type A sorting domain-containing protein [Lewinellaceae bacterium]|nr:T9SS type A sorting domain-containing protein [Lewinellaceae bacterium]
MNCRTTTLLLLLVSWAVSLTAQTPFFSEDFGDQAQFATRWKSGGTNSGPEVWKWSNATQGVFQGQPAFGATTAANGFALFNSDANGNFQHDVTLTNATAIDCSGRSKVYIRFESQYGFYSAPSQSIAELGVSTDGTNFTYRRVLESVPQNSVRDAVQVVILEIPEAANKATVFLRFRWRGFYEYAWRLDDIGLFEVDPQPEYDLIASAPLIPNNFATPLSQTEDIFFGFTITNKGTKAQSPITAGIQVLSSNGQTFNRDTSLTSFASGLTDTLIFARQMTVADTGSYAMQYLVSSAQTDGIPGDNSVTAGFLVTRGLFSKDDGEIISATAPDNVQGDIWEIGNYYFVPKGGYQAYEASFSVASENNAHQGKSVSLLLYKITDNGDAQFNDADLTIVGYGFHEFKTEENFDLITTKLFDLETNNEGIPLEANADYFLMVQYAADMFCPYSSLTYHYNQLATVVKNGDWFTGGFGDDVTALVRMRIRETATATREPELAASQVKLLPNPADDLLQVQMELETVSPTAELRVFDVAGRTLQRMPLQQFKQGVINIDTRRWNDGVYFLYIQTAEGVRTERFVVQHK